MGVLLALRKLGSDKVAEFLTDTEPRIVAEAARAIYDERMMNAFAGAREARGDRPAQPDAVAFRALAANFWLGTPEAAARVAKFAGRASEPDYTRAFALKLLGELGDTGRRDPITGITMDLPQRDRRRSRPTRSRRSAPACSPGPTRCAARPRRPSRSSASRNSARRWPRW